MNLTFYSLAQGVSALALRPTHYGGFLVELQGWPWVVENSEVRKRVVGKNRWGFWEESGWVRHALTLRGSAVLKL
jgi:hypothetical protein